LNRSKRVLPPHYRWNFLAFLADITSFNIAFSFISVDTIAPAMVSQLTSSPLLIGLVGTVFRGSWMLPQLAVAHIVKDHPRKKPFLYPGLAGRVIALGILVTGLVSGGPTGFILTAIYVSFALFAMSDGMIAVSWFDILARAIPVSRRGRLFGIGQAVGRLAGMGVGVVIAAVLSDPRFGFPVNFAILYGLAAVGLVPSVVALLSLREPPPVEREDDVSSESQKDWLRVLRRDKAFRRLMSCRIMVAALMLSSSFFVVHAARVAKLPQPVIGQFVVAQTLGGLVASLAFGWLSDRFGPRMVIRVGVGLSALAPLLGLCSDLVGGGVVFYYGIFIALGVWYSMWSLGFFNYLLELAPEHMRPIYVGASNTIMGVTTLAPIIGGWLLEQTSFGVLFLLTSVMMVSAFFLSLRLTDPRTHMVSEMSV